MTLDEKVAQLLAIWNRKREIQNAQGRFDPAKAQALIGPGIGEVARPSEIAGGGSRSPRDHAQFVNAVQKWLIENTRLGIPAMFHEEALHGLVAPGGTHFPVPIGLASTWDPALIERLMSVAALEARARGVQHVLSPVVDLGRDPRWGRIEETYGEDPYLVSRMGVAAVRGYQGTIAAARRRQGVRDPEALRRARVARRRHQHRAAARLRAPAARRAAGAVRGGGEGGRLHRDAELQRGGRRAVAREQLAAHRRPAPRVGIQRARRLRLLRDRAAADAPPRRSGPSRRRRPGARGRRRSRAAGPVRLSRARRAGQDVAALPSRSIDRSVVRVLRAKFLAGLFEQSVRRSRSRANASANTPAHQALALEAARKSIVLLKNEGGLLPLDRGRVKTLAVIGPNAKGLHLGGYSRDPRTRRRRARRHHARVRAPASGSLYAEGVRITEHDANWSADTVVLGDPRQNRARIQEAVTVARQADAIVLAIGTNESVSREAWADNHLGDVADSPLMSNQEELVEAMLADRQAGRSRS